MKIRSRPALAALVVVAALLAVAFAWRRKGTEVALATATVDRGDILDVVGATGTLEAVVTVQVGSQVSGTIQDLHADFNSQVKKGQVIARLDPSLFEARLGQAKANLIAARANVERSRAEVGDTRQKYERARELAEEKLLPDLRPGDREGQLRRRGGPGRRRARRRSARPRPTSTRPSWTSRTPSSPPPSTGWSSPATWTWARPWPRPSRPRCCSSSPTTSPRCGSTRPSTRPTWGASRPGRT